MTTTKLRELCRRWNDLTKPYVFKSDEVHERDRRVARKIYSILMKHSDRIQEYSNGSLYVIPMSYEL